MQRRNEFFHFFKLLLKNLTINVTEHFLFFIYVVLMKYFYVFVQLRKTKP